MAAARLARRTARDAASWRGSAGKSGEERRSMSTVAARGPIRSSASGTVPTEFSRSTESEFARMRRSRVRYGSSAAMGTIAEVSSGDFLSSSSISSAVSGKTGRIR
jgi:hypothetical protein